MFDRSVSRKYQNVPNDDAGDTRPTRLKGIPCEKDVRFSILLRRELITEIIYFKRICLLNVLLS